jgi:hypothetical protein
MSIRCQDCPFFDASNRPDPDYCTHPDNATLYRGLPFQARPDWCRRRRDAAKRCARCGSLAPCQCAVLS